MTTAKARAKAEELLAEVTRLVPNPPVTIPGSEVGVRLPIQRHAHTEDEKVAILARALLLAQAETVEGCRQSASATIEIMAPWLPEPPDAYSRGWADGLGAIVAAMRNTAAALRRAAEEMK